MAANQRPYKVWNCDRTDKKSVTAAGLVEFVNKAKDKLKIGSQETVTVVFESDGTEVDEDDYFQFLPFNTTLMILKSGERWCSHDHMQGQDEPDAMLGDGQQVSERVGHLASGLKRDITRLITFSNEDLQEMAEMSTPNLAMLLGDTETFARVVQEACQRHLDERLQTSEALDLLKLYHRAREHSPYVEEDDPKRMKFGQL